MVLMRARESFEDLEKRYNTKPTKIGIKSGIAAIMTCHISYVGGRKLMVRLHGENETRLRTRLMGNRNCKRGGRRGRRGRRVLNHSAEKVGGDGGG